MHYCEYLRPSKFPEKEVKNVHIYIFVDLEMVSTKQPHYLWTNN